MSDGPVRAFAAALVVVTIVAASAATAVTRAAWLYRERTGEGHAFLGAIVAWVVVLLLAAATAALLWSLRPPPD